MTFFTTVATLVAVEIATIITGTIIVRWIIIGIIVRIIKLSCLIGVIRGSGCAFVCEVTVAIAFVANYIGIHDSTSSTVESTSGRSASETSERSARSEGSSTTSRGWYASKITIFEVIFPFWVFEVFRVRFIFSFFLEVLFVASFSYTVELVSSVVGAEFSNLGRAGGRG